MMLLFLRGTVARLLFNKRRVLGFVVSRPMLLVVMSTVCLTIGAACTAGVGSGSDGAQSESIAASSVVEELDPAEPSSPYELNDDEIAALARKAPEPTPLQLFFETYAPEEKTPIEYEEALAGCMALHGFEYVPYVYDVDLDLAAYNDVYVVSATLGYGISTLLGREPIAVLEPSTVDPNEAKYESLTDNERVEYDVVIGDCQEEVGLVPTDEQVAQMEIIYAEVVDLQREIDDQVEADSDVIEAWEAWRLCMGRAGYHYQDRQQIHAELSGETHEILREMPELASGAILIENISGEMADKLAALQTKERAIAQVDLACRRDLDDTLHEVRVKLEQAAIERDPARFERVAMALGEMQANSGD